MTCAECGSSRVYESVVPGLLACRACGKVFPGKFEPIDPDPAEAGQDRDLSESSSMDAVDIKVPDLAECVIGWRAWGVRPRWSPGSMPLLQSVTYGDAFWTPGRPMRATCGKASRKGHEVPMESCSCGLYSAKTYEHLMSMSYHRYDAEMNGLFHVVGRVRLWGKVIEGTQGWRAEIGYPDELYVPYEAWSIAEPLREAYQARVMLKNILSGAA